MKPSTFSTASCGTIKYRKKALIDAVTASIVDASSSSSFVAQPLELRLHQSVDGGSISGRLASRGAGGKAATQLWPRNYYIISLFRFPRPPTTPRIWTHADLGIHLGSPG